MQVVALAGGVGASKLLWGLYRVLDPAALTIIVNTGDDIELHGLSISPDLDIVTYTLADVVNPTTGWGFKDDTHALLQALARFGKETWFCLGDRDSATHLYRTECLRAGVPLTQVTEAIRRAFGVAARILPMSNQPVRTMIETERGVMHFQEYLVKNRAEPTVRGIAFQGIERSRPAPGVLEALREGDAILICPSNPLISIGPILAVPGIREALRSRRERVIAVSPIVGGKSLKGPSDRMLRQLGREASARSVAQLYRDVAGSYVLDREDASARGQIESLGFRVFVTDTVMRDDRDKIRLARELVPLLEMRPESSLASERQIR
jgi:LPPG:FO 2-phospho-L-lactate transferase